MIYHSNNDPKAEKEKMMNEQTRLCCELFIENKERIKLVFGWDGGLVHLACAGIYTAKDKRVDEGTLQFCKDLLNQKFGVFSNFRSTARSPIASMLAVSANPEQTLGHGLEVYELLKKDFWGSVYLPLAAMVIAQMIEQNEYGRVAARTRLLYERMKSAHPFLTSGEDSAFCALMALSNQSDDNLIRDVEVCYHTLKPYFFSGNAVQSLSHVLALCEGQTEEKCERTMTLFNKLKAVGYKYGTEYELPTLGVLAMTDGDSDEIIAKLIEIDGWLSAQKGFGFFSGVTGKQRLMYAGILAQKDFIQNGAMQTAALNGTVSLLVAQQAAMCAAVAGSAAAASAANHG
ncbi:MAG: hypothetical protein K0Q48_2853 [Bacillota bacterium]|jgi:hypothetical protein|nr:hypothetical protein [Bacillota bacterium]